MIQEPLPEWPDNASAFDPRLAGFWLDQSRPDAARYTQRQPIPRRPSWWRRVLNFITRRIG